VDDIPDFVASMTELFQDCWGYSKISGFCSGPDFLEHYRKGENEPPDIVFLDIDLPYMNGLDVLKCALLDDIFKETIFVAISEYLRSVDREWLGYIGFDDYNPKPCDMESLRTIIQQTAQDKKSILARRNPYKNLFAVVEELSNLRLRKAVLENNFVKRLISPEVFELLDTSPKNLTPKYSDAAVGFVDIRGFTQLMNHIQIDQVDELLKLFFESAYKYIVDGGGYLDKFIGDEVMWFHVGDVISDISKRCIQVGSAIISGNGELNRRIQSKLHQRIRINVGVGIACGTCAVGVFGAPKHRIQYSLLGPAVNLASRLCSEARSGELLVGGGIIEHCMHNTRRIGFRTIKGFDHEIEIRKVVIPKTKRQFSAD